MNRTETIAERISVFVFIMKAIVHIAAGTAVSIA